MARITYAIARCKTSGHLKLVEFSSVRCFENAANDFKSPYGYRRVEWQEAHKWVRDGHLHETALYMDEDKVRRAKEQG
jgi:hypothetical protein